MIDQMNISEVYDLESYETAFVEEDPFHEIGQQLVLEEMKNFKIAEPRVLEIGGGSGLFTLRLAAACPNARITVIEPDKEWFRVLRERTEGLPNIRTKRARIEELNSPRNYHVC